MGLSPKKASPRKPAEQPPPPPPKPVETARSAGPPRIDFIQRNIDGASGQKSRAKPAHVPTAKERAADARHAPGEVPRYLQARKDAIRGDDRLAPKSQYPPGMRLLSDEEKADAVQGLTEQKEELTARLARMPLRVEGPTALREKRLVEAELDEIDKSIAQLGKKYVFVPDD
jgi:hypothetical protein